MNIGDVIAIVLCCYATIGMLFEWLIKFYIEI